MTRNRKIQKIQELFQLYRGFILDSCEHEIENEEKWVFLRRRLLKLLSQDRGLESKVLELVMEGANDEDFN